MKARQQEGRKCNGGGEESPGAAVEEKGQGCSKGHEMAKREAAKRKKTKTSEIFVAPRVAEEQREKRGDGEGRLGKNLVGGISVESQHPEVKGEAAAENKKKSKKEENFSASGIAQEKEEKTVVVGIRMDAQSRELLTWALVKVAAPRDSVVAVHVLSLPSSFLPAGVGGVTKDPGDPPATFLSLAKDLSAMLAVYDGFCNLKQIDLKLKICNGSSIRKVLVRETKAFAASRLVLGVTKDKQGGGSPSISVAKYCAKKLPSNCSVAALSNGKMVFQREAAASSVANNRKSQRMNIDLTKHNSGKSGELFCLFSVAGPNRLSDKTSWLLPEDELNGSVTSSAEKTSPTINDLLRNSCSVGVPESDSGVLSELENEAALSSVPTEKSEDHPSNPETVAIKDVPEARPGWASLSGMVITNKKTATSEKHKISVVKWAKWLPNQHSYVHPDLKSKKSGGQSTHNADGHAMPPQSFLILLTDLDRSLLEELESLKEKYSSVCRKFSFEELAQATSIFSPENLIGKGGSSSVYKGCLPNGNELAVKILKPSKDAVKEFLSEIEILSTLHHKSIVSLLGFCLEKQSLILVYDYVSRGSLEKVLHGEKENKNVLRWSDRYKIAIGVAEALDFLHKGCGTEPVIHRDVKSSNILLSENFDPQLSDFGLAKWASESTSQLICTDVAGTFGYMAPEYALHGTVNEKIDVYALGVVLLELLSGRKPIDTVFPDGHKSLVMWAKPFLQNGDIHTLKDPDLGNEFNCDQAEMMILAASLCIRRLHQARPRVALVLKLLQGDDDTVKWARSEVNSRPDVLDDEMSNLGSDIRSHLNLALYDVEDDSISTSSTDHTIDSLTVSSSTEDCLQWRCSRSSIFD